MGEDSVLCNHEIGTSAYPVVTQICIYIPTIIIKRLSMTPPYITVYWTHPMEGATPTGYVAYQAAEKRW